MGSEIIPPKPAFQHAIIPSIHYAGARYRQFSLIWPKDQVLDVLSKNIIQVSGEPKPSPAPFFTFRRPCRIGLPISSERKFGKRFKFIDSRPHTYYIPV